MKSILIKDTTREERIRIVTQSLQVCGQTCEFCNGCDNLGGGMVDSYFQPYINGEKEIAELNAAYHCGLVRSVHGRRNYDTGTGTDGTVCLSDH